MRGPVLEPVVEREAGALPNFEARSCVARIGVAKATSTPRSLRSIQESCAVAGKLSGSVRRSPMSQPADGVREWRMPLYQEP